MNKRFNSIILKCQELRDRYGFDYENICSDKIKKYSEEIKSKKLIEKCNDQIFANQLCIANSLITDF